MPTEAWTLARFAPELIFGLIMFCASYATARLLISECRKDKVEINSRFDRALEVAAKNGETANILAEEVRRARR